MFEDRLLEHTQRLKEIAEEKEELLAEEKSIKESIKNIKTLEEEIKSEATCTGTQSFVLAENDLDNINKDFIKNANNWIEKHEKAFHPRLFYQTKDFLKNTNLYIKPTYTVSVTWTNVGRLLAIECESCKKQLDSKDYMFVDEA